MLSIDIPGLGIHDLEHLVLDVNGTIAYDGTLISGMADALAALKPILRISAVTADTHGTSAAVCEGLGIELKVIPAGQETEAKLDFVEELGADRVVAIGNGANDELMLRASAIGIAVLGPEGCSAAAAGAADVLAADILTALGLLAEPKRLMATLRR